MLLRDTGPSSAATRIWRIAACKGVRTGCLVSEGDRQNESIAAFSADSGVIFIDAVVAEKWGKRKKRRYSDEESFEWSSPVLPMALVLAADLFAACSLLTDKSRRFIL